MYSWQLITGTGFLMSSSYVAAQAFYVNQLGGILAVISIICAMSLILENPRRIYYISFPILAAAIFYAMPMNVFQQAKDMKLDPALLFITISGCSLLFSGWRRDDSTRNNLSLLVISGIIIGLAFSTKATSLMTILAFLGLIAYRMVGFLGFIGFFSGFLAIFTYLNLWKMMNVWMPSDQSTLMMMSL
jgi:4-amino-4-deoxy-L-arabinose transferase-like glycosyltransferase